MRLCRYFGIAFLVLCLVGQNVAFAAAVPAYTGGMNSAVGSVVKFKMSKWGFAANDPRYVATTAAIGAGLTEAAVAIGTGVVSTVGWPAVLAGAGISAIAGGLVALVPSLIDWLWGDGSDSQKVKLSGVGMGTSNGSNLPPAPSTFPEILDNYGLDKDLYFRQSDGKIMHVRTVRFVCQSSSYCDPTPPWDGYFLDESFTESYSGPFSGENGYWSKDYSRTVESEGEPFEHHFVYVYNPPSGVEVTPPSYTPTLKPIPDAVSDIPDSVLTQPISDKMLADAVNAAWKNAAADSNAVPWSASDPVTSADIAAWRAANPDNVPMPTVRDFISPVSPTNSSAVPLPAPGASATTPPTTPGSGVTVDLGPDPNTPAPTLEPIPTASQILGPLFGLMPDLKNFSVPGHSASCPQPSFSVFGRSYVISSHCDLIESNRTVIEAAMLLVWTIVAVLIVLRA